MEGSKSTTARPIGVWIVTIMDGLTGVIGIGGVLIVLWVSSTRPQAKEVMDDLGLGPASIVLTSVLALAIVYTAFKTWKGSQFHMRLLLVVITIFCGAKIVNNLQFLYALGDELTDQQTTKLIGNVTRSGVLLFVNYLYFLTPNARKFFRRAAK